MDNDRERTSRCSGTKIVDPLENARYRLESARLSGPDQLRVLLAIVEFIGAVSECNLPVANLFSSSVSVIARRILIDRWYRYILSGPAILARMDYCCTVTFPRNWYRDTLHHRALDHHLKYDRIDRATHWRFFVKWPSLVLASTPELCRLFRRV